MSLDATQSKGRINLEKAQVLIVESNPQGMDILSQVLNGFGVRGAHKCETVEAAWAILKTAELDLIVCSASLTDGDGFDFIAELRRSALEPNKFASVLLVTGHTPMSHIRKARDCGANMVVTKPITPRVLLERIIWIAREPRAFIEAGVYSGPDRRFQNLGPPPGEEGRRRDDLPLEIGEAETPNLQQEDIDALLTRKKAFQ
jgi:DNA-binding response OmpR family regulator